MYKFVLNKNRQSNGDNEVHNATSGCSHMPLSYNQIDLGVHLSCREAVSKAKVQYQNNRINGCLYCCPSCHTS